MNRQTVTAEIAYLLTLNLFLKTISFKRTLVQSITVKLQANVRFRDNRIREKGGGVIQKYCGIKFLLVESVRPD